MIDRRAFVSTAASVLVGTGKASAQRSDVRRIGIVSTLSETEMRSLAAAFRSRLGELGWVEGHNMTLEIRAAGGDYARLVTEAGLLISGGIDVIVAQGSPSLTAVQQHSRNVPVVFLVVADPIGLGFVRSMARPGGHATGFTNFDFSIGAKWLQLLVEIDGRIDRVSVITNPANPNSEPFSAAIAAGSRALGLEVTVVPVTSAVTIEAAIASAGKSARGGLIFLPDGLPFLHRALIIRATADHRLPAVYPFRVFAAEGGLMSYGLDLADTYRQAAVYVDKILKGANPSDLPVQAPTKLELVVNLKTAAALGLTIPASILLRADEVIE